MGTKSRPNARAAGEDPQPGFGPPGGDGRGHREVGVLLTGVARHGGKVGPALGEIVIEQCAGTGPPPPLAGDVAQSVAQRHQPDNHPTLNEASVMSGSSARNAEAVMPNIRSCEPMAAIAQRGRLCMRDHSQAHGRTRTVRRQPAASQLDDPSAGRAERTDQSNHQRTNPRIGDPRSACCLARSPSLFPARRATLSQPATRLD